LEVGLENSKRKTKKKVQLENPRDSKSLTQKKGRTFGLSEAGAFPAGALPPVDGFFSAAAFGGILNLDLDLN
jgi:hypothetical protein